MLPPAWHSAWCTVLLENPRDIRAWWAAIYGVAQSQTWLKWLSSSSSSSSSSNSEYKLNKYTALTYSFPYLKPVCCSMSSSNCCFLTCIQISQEADHVVWYSHLFQSFPQFVVIHTVKGFGIVNKGKVDVFLEPSYFFDDPIDAGNLISCSSTFSKSSLNMWKFTVHVLLKPGLENFKHYFASVWNECNCAVVWTFFGIAFLWDWNEHWTFPVLWPLLSFPNRLAYWAQHFHSIISWDLK